MDVFYRMENGGRTHVMSLDDARNAAVMAWVRAGTLARERRAVAEGLATTDRHADVVAVGVDGGPRYPVRLMAYPELYQPEELPTPPAGLAPLRTRPARYQGRHRA